jgi:hypothetical protein
MKKNIVGWIPVHSLFQSPGSGADSGEGLVYGGHIPPVGCTLTVQVMEQALQLLYLAGHTSQTLLQLNPYYSYTAKYIYLLNAIITGQEIFAIDLIRAPSESGTLKELVKNEAFFYSYY